MLRGIFLMSRPPLLREGGDFATLQLNPSKTKPPFVNTSRMPSRRGFWRDAAVYFGQDCLSREIYSQPKIFLTNVQTPVSLRERVPRAKREPDRAKPKVNGG